MVDGMPTPDDCLSCMALREENARLRAEVAACDGHAYLRDEIKRLEAKLAQVVEALETVVPADEARYRALAAAKGEQP